MAKTLQQLTKQYARVTAKNAKSWDRLRTAAIKSQRRGSRVEPGAVARAKVNSRQSKIDAAYTGRLNAAAEGGDRYAKAWATRIAKYGSAGFSARGIRILEHGKWGN